MNTGEQKVALPLGNGSGVSTTSVSPLSPEVDDLEWMSVSAPYAPEISKPESRDLGRSPLGAARGRAATGPIAAERSPGHATRGAGEVTRLAITSDAYTDKGGQTPIHDFLVPFFFFLFY